MQQRTDEFKRQRPHIFVHHQVCQPAVKLQQRHRGARVAQAVRGAVEPARAAHDLVLCAHGLVVTRGALAAQVVEAEQAKAQQHELARACTRTLNVTVHCCAHPAADIAGSMLLAWHQARVVVGRQANVALRRLLAGCQMCIRVVPALLALLCKHAVHVHNKGAHIVPMAMQKR